jgi:uncharacterized protein DUF4148
MKRNSLALALAGVLALAGLAAQAESPDPSGQYAVSVASTRTRADVLAELKKFKQSGVNPWSIQYNQLAGFRSTRTPAAVRAEFLANRDEAKAMTSEDSGAAYLASHKPAETPRQLAGQPTKAE